MIYHIVTESQWKLAQQRGVHEAESLVTEGFIHASNKDQVQGVVERYYKAESNLLLLHIDEQKLTAELKYEFAPSVNQVFPHIYGPLNLDAVTTITTI